MRIVGRCLLTVVRIVALILTIPLMLLSVSIEIVGKWVSLFASLIGNLAIIMSIFGFMTGFWTNEECLYYLVFGLAFDIVPVLITEIAKGGGDLISDLLLKI